MNFLGREADEQQKRTLPGELRERSLEFAIDRMTEQDLIDEADALRRSYERYRRILIELDRRAKDRRHRRLRGEGLLP